MKHEKTFDAIGKLKDVEMELHRLKNALEMANRALDAQRQWVGMTDEEISDLAINNPPMVHEFARAIEAKLREKNGGQA